MHGTLKMSLTACKFNFKKLFVLTLNSTMSGLKAMDDLNIQYWQKILRAKNRKRKSIRKRPCTRLWEWLNGWFERLTSIEDIPELNTRNARKVRSGAWDTYSSRPVVSSLEQNNYLQTKIFWSGLSWKRFCFEVLTEVTFPQKVLGII